MERRERWFTDGAAALRRTLTAMGMEDSLPSAGQFYAYPLCLMTYGRDAFDGGVFSDEHVPPLTAGGRALVLTCRRCNNTAGTAMDADAAGREAVRDFLAGRSPSRDLRAEFAVGEVSIKGNINNINGAVVMSVVPKANNPYDITNMTRTLTQWADQGVGGRIGFRFMERVSPTAARLSWVRAAYLVAFAAFGWRYAFQACLNPLRAQLAAPAASILPPLAFFDLGASRERRQLLVVEEPAEMRSLAVVLGRHTVFLPGVMEPQPLMPWPLRSPDIRHCRRRIGNACASRFPGRPNHNTLSTDSRAIHDFDAPGQPEVMLPLMVSRALGGRLRHLPHVFSKAGKLG